MSEKTERPLNIKKITYVFWWFHYWNEAFDQVVVAKKWFRWIFRKSRRNSLKLVWEKALEIGECMRRDENYISNFITRGFPDTGIEFINDSINIMIWDYMRVIGEKIVLQNFCEKKYFTDLYSAAFDGFQKHMNKIRKDENAAD